jgi:TonB family protein
VQQNQDELELLREWQIPGEDRRTLSAGAVSVMLHVLFFIVLLSLPQSAFRPPERPQRSRQQVTPLIAPPSQLTQKEPNRGKIGHEFDLETLLPRPAVTPRVSAPSSTQPAARRFAPPTPPPTPRVTPQAPLPAPPSIVAGQDQIAHAPALGGVPNAVPPPPRDEKPKLAFEKPGAITGDPTGSGLGIQIPRPSVQDAIRGASPGSARGGVVIGDLGEGIGGLGTVPNLPPSPPRMGSNVELLSDPLGVDFRPYLIQVLAAVRRNWIAVIPETARLGQRGRVVIQFAVRRDGKVTKLVFASEAGPGAQALDRAAVASISASDPFPPLPNEFRGEHVRLQLAFLYNIPSR